MKIAFKTAHGYLSFQPDSRSDKTDQTSVRVEYRDKRGIWEEVEVEGLEFPMPVPVPPGPGPSPAPSPTPDTGTPTAAYVAEIKAACQAAGLNLSGPCGAFEITKRVAWGLRQSGAGLLSKPSGNSCNSYATDIVAYRDRAYDILGDGGGANNPTWQETGVDDLANRWRPAVQP